MCLKDVQSNWATGSQHIKNIVHDYWMAIYSNDSSPGSNDETNQVLRELDLPSLSANQQEALSQLFSHDEIKHAMFSIADSKSPGPDEFTAEFYKGHWDLIGSDINMAIQGLFQNGFLLKAKHGIIPS